MKMLSSWLMCLAFGFAVATSHTDAAGFDEDLYKSYLYWPRLHFSGLFQADTPTPNNEISNYNLLGHTHFSTELNGTGGWNPNGTGSFRLARTLVTRVCFRDGRCGTDKHVDPIMGSLLEEADPAAAPKLIALDPDQSDASTIYGWRLKINNYLIGDVHPCPETLVWNKENTTEPRMQSGGAAFHSFIENITWLEGAQSSSFLRQLHKAVEYSKTGRLSLHFHLDQYQKCALSESFTWGRIVGAIGVSGSRTPLTVVHGRELEPRETNRAQNAPFVLDLQNRRVHVDFGNSLMTTSNGSFSVTSVGQLAVGYSREKLPHSHNCSNDFDWLGLVHYRRHDWYQTTAGIQTFPESNPMAKEQMNKLERTPLVVAEVEGVWPNISCKDIFLEEAAHGTLVRPYGETSFRRDPGEHFNFDAFVTKFGKPLPGVPVHLRLGSETTDKSGLPLPSAPSTTNASGMVSFKITTRDPKHPRKYIDGQVYRILLKANNLSFGEDFVIFVLVWDKYQINTAPTWINHVYPIFKVYANLSPAMTKEFLDLGNLDEVEKYKKIIKMSMVLPFEHPNHMPISRDLSNAKRKMILEWLSQPQLLHGIPDSKTAHMLKIKHVTNLDFKNGKPLLQCIVPGTVSMSLKPSGQTDLAPVKTATKKYKRPKHEAKHSQKSHYSLETLRQDLQTALEVEHATIPPYMTALYSIKNGHNKNVNHLLKSILVQEMLHLSLVANILNAVGGKPSLTHRNFVPRYPSKLPGAVHRGLVVPLQKLSRSLIKDVFMKIEEPALTIKALKERQYLMNHRVDYWHHRGVDLPSNSAIKTGRSTQNVAMRFNRPERNTWEGDRRQGSTKERALRQEEDEIQRDFQIKRRDGNEGKAEERLPCVYQDDPSASLQSNDILEKHKDTIGTFYHHIIKTLGYLTKCGKDNSIFTGHSSRQLTSEVWYSRKAFGHGKMIKVTDYSSAVRAIIEIIEQGEGSSPCTPFAADIDIHDLSHYFSFYSIYKGRKVQHKSWNGTELPAGISDDAKKWFKVCGSIYTFSGNKINFDPTGVWPIVHNPRMSDHTPWSRSYMQALTFNKTYRKLLESLEKAYNGHPNVVQDAMGLMFSVGLNAKRLVRMPLKPGGDPDVGPNAAPIYEPI